MRISIDDQNKMLALWLNNQEDIEKNITQDTKEAIDEYKKKKYKICIFQSGTEDIKTNLLKLILNNAS